MKVAHVTALFSLLILPIPGLSDDRSKSQDIYSPQQLERMEKLQEMQQKQLERMNEVLPTRATFMEKMKNMFSVSEEDHKRASEQSAQLNGHVDQALNMIEKGETTKAKFLIKRVSWIPIGVPPIDRERASHYDSVRDDLSALVK